MEIDVFSCLVGALWLCACVRAIDENGMIYGLIQTDSVPIETDNILPQCFYGMGVENCAIVNSAELGLNNYNYYQEIQNPVEASEAVSVYCLEWPYWTLNSADSLVEWNVLCDPVTGDYMDHLNSFGLQIRLAANRWVGDTEIITCPMKRDACTYDQDDYLVGCEETALYMAGFNLTVSIKPKDDGSARWRNVVRCSAEVWETAAQPTAFRARLVLEDASAEAYALGAAALALLLAALLAAAAAALRYFRTKTCDTCHAKLFLGVSKCWKCIFLGAHSPPPALMHMIEHRVEHPEDWHIGPDPSYFTAARRMQQGSLKSRCKAFCELISKYCCCCLRLVTKKTKSIAPREDSIRSFYSKNSNVALANSNVAADSSGSITQKPKDTVQMGQAGRLKSVAGSVPGKGAPVAGRSVRRHGGRLQSSTPASEQQASKASPPHGEEEEDSSGADSGVEEKEGGKVRASVVSFVS